VSLFRHRFSAIHPNVEKAPIRNLPYPASDRLHIFYPLVSADKSTSSPEPTRLGATILNVDGLTGVRVSLRCAVQVTGGRTYNIRLYDLTAGEYLPGTISGTNESIEAKTLELELLAGERMYEVHAWLITGAGASDFVQVPCAFIDVAYIGGILSGILPIAAAQEAIRSSAAAGLGAVVLDDASFPGATFTLKCAAQVDAGETYRLRLYDVTAAAYLAGDISDTNESLEIKNLAVTPGAGERIYLLEGWMVTGGDAANFVQVPGALLEISPYAGFPERYACIVASRGQTNLATPYRLGAAIFNIDGIEGSTITLRCAAYADNARNFNIRLYDATAGAYVVGTINDSNSTPEVKTLPLALGVGERIYELHAWLVTGAGSGDYLHVPYAAIEVTP